MNKITYSIDDIKNLKSIFEKLFPEEKDIEVNTKSGLITIKFSKTKSWFWKMVIPKLTSTVIPLYELLFTQVAKRLSYRKVKNDTYSSLYLDQISFVAIHAPQFMCKFLTEKIDELPEAPKTTFSDILWDTQSIASKDLENENEKLHILKIFDTRENTVMANLLSQINSKLH
jgi:hypothetical protein